MQHLGKGPTTKSDDFLEKFPSDLVADPSLTLVWDHELVLQQYSYIKCLKDTVGNILDMRHENKNEDDDAGGYLASGA